MNEFAFVYVCDIAIVALYLASILTEVIYIIINMLRALIIHLKMWPV